jgi:hypothetical protein
VRTCPDEVIAGVLSVRGGEFVLVRADSSAVRLIWPDGFVVRRDGATLVLIDPAGVIAAHADDTVRLRGGRESADVWRVCGSLDVSAQVHGGDADVGESPSDEAR